MDEVVDKGEGALVAVACLALGDWFDGCIFGDDVVTDIPVTLGELRLPVPPLGVALGVLFVLLLQGGGALVIVAGPTLPITADGIVLDGDEIGDCCMKGCRADGSGEGCGEPIMSEGKGAKDGEKLEGNIG